MDGQGLRWVEVDLGSFGLLGSGKNLEGLGGGMGCWVDWVGLA